MDAIADYLRVCEQAVRAAGAAIRGWVGRTTVTYKGPADLLTEADLAAQEIVRATVLGAFPDHCLLGEESQPGNGTRPSAARDVSNRELQPTYRWITDPLDGTTNFAHGVPHYCTSLALEHRGRVLVGAVYDPCLNECFTAAAGQGAWLNGRPIHASGAADLCSALLATGFPTHLTADSLDFLLFNAAAFQVEGIRRTGSAALNLCYLAAGRFDVCWGFSTKIWDVAAGTLLVQEAGGEITAPQGGPFVLETARYIGSANPTLHAELRALVARVMQL